MSLLSTLAGVFFLTTFFSILAIFIILRLGGNSFRNYIKSKFGLWKKKGSWFLIFSQDRKVTFQFKTFPKDNKVLIKSGEIPEEDQYASINEVYHQLDKSGNPVILAMEDLPFTFFLKKHHLNDFFPTIDKMIKVIDMAIDNGTEEEISNLEIKIKRRFQDSKDKLKYIPDAWKNYKVLMDLDNILSKEAVKGIAINKIKKLKLYKQILLSLKQSIISANHHIVDVNDLFQSVGFVKNITKMAFSEYQNGWLAFRQAHTEKKINTLLLVVTIIIGIFVLIGMYLTYSQNKQMSQIQNTVNINSNKVDNLYKYINPDYEIGDVNSNQHPLNVVIDTNSGK